MNFKAVSINEKEEIFLDGKRLESVAAYKLENSFDSKEPAKLTVTVYVSMDRVCYECGDNIIKAVSINEKEEIFLDDEQLENVIAYKLENSADSKEPAKLTVAMHVIIDRVCSEVKERM